MPGVEIEGFRIVINTRDERGHKPHVHVIKDAQKCKILLDESLLPYDILMKSRDVRRARIPVPPLTDAMYERGVRNARKSGPFDVVRAQYSRAEDALDLTLRKGITVSFPRKQIRELARARPAFLTNVEIQPGGDGITFRRLNVDIYVPGLLAEELGSLFAKALGRKTRGRTSNKKAAASRANGRKGGRPKKSRAAA